MPGIPLMSSVDLIKQKEEADDDDDEEEDKKNTPLTFDKQICNFLSSFSFGDILVAVILSANSHLFNI